MQNWRKRIKHNLQFQFGLILTGILLLIVNTVYAGPPYLTDDPEPVDYQHWEFYIGSQFSKDLDGGSGTAPHFEVNYGLIPDVQIHLIAPLSFVSPKGDKSHYGYGDTELGLKYRFIHESDNFPQVGIFPLLEIPTGNSHEGLGSGHTQAFFPIWFQKDIGKWTTYGGGGYWINPGEGNKNWGFVGWQIQRQITEKLTPGFEIYHSTPQEVGGKSETGFNIGLIVDLNEENHLLFSGGHTFNNSNNFNGYVAYQWTFGPEEKKD